LDGTGVPGTASRNATRNRGTGEIELGRAARQLLPESGFLAKVAQKAVEIGEIAQPLSQVVVVKQVRGTVQDHVGGHRTRNDLAPDGREAASSFAESA
jgi:hypothetical protein